MKRNLWTGIVAVAIAVAMIGGAVALAGSTTANSKGILSSDEINTIVNTTTDTTQVTSPFIQVANNVRSSIVGVNNYETVSSRYYYGYGFGYGNGNNNSESSEQLAATGSGVVISNYGHILTNYHVVEDATRLTVTIASSEKEYDATLISYDEDLDLAILHVNDLPLTAVTLGDSDQLQVGEWAIVIGNPLGEEFARTVTVGVVSALDREVTDTTYDRYGRKTSITNTMIQVDAAISSGNSGGGMFNTLGQLMGIPARKYTASALSSASIDNIGMCIPINVAKPLIQEVLENYTGNDSAATTKGTTGSESSSKPTLGVTISTQLSGDKLPQGALVRKVDANSNAANGGIQPGDVIVEVNGTVVSSTAELKSIISACKEGDTITVKVFRAEGMAEQAENNSLDLSKVGDGEYIDLTITMHLNASL